MNIVRVAVLQRWLIVLIFVNALLGIAQAVGALPNVDPAEIDALPASELALVVTLALVRLALFVASAIVLVSLMRVLGNHIIWQVLVVLVCIGALAVAGPFGLAFFVAAITVAVRATGVLREHGLKVGLLGASPAEARTLVANAPPIAR